MDHDSFISNEPIKIDYDMIFSYIYRERQFVFHCFHLHLPPIKKSLFSIAFPFLLFVYFLILIVCLRFIILMLFFTVISYVVFFYAYSLLNFSFGVCFYILCF